MEEQSRPESAAEEHATPPEEPMLAAAPSDPADAATVAESAESAGQESAVPDAAADARIHPWQVLSASMPEPVSPLEVAPASADAPAARVDEQEIAAPVVEWEIVVLEEEQHAPAPVVVQGSVTLLRELDIAIAEPPAEGVDLVTPVALADEDDGAARIEGSAAVAPIEEQDTVALIKRQEAGGPAREDNAGAPLAAPLEHPLEPPTVADAEAPIAAAVGMAPMAGDAAAPLPIFTAATVPPAEPRSRREGDLPLIPVDPSAETVPLNARTDQVIPVGRAYPGYPGYPGSPKAGTPPARIASLREPLARDAVARFLTAACGAIVLAAVLGLLFTEGEWATGLAAASIAALLVAGAYLLGTVARVAAGARKDNTLRLGLAATVIFGVAGGVGLALNGSLHQVQAGVLASVGDYGGAVREYQLAGYEPPNGDLARAYVGWGNAMLHQGDYADAAGSFQVVLERYASTSAAPDAGRGLLQAYEGWMASASMALPYPTMLRDLATVSAAPSCDSACAAAAARLSARAQLAYGAALNNQGKYTQAIAQFESVSMLYPSSPYAATAHEDAAITYYMYGQSQRFGKTCSDAVPTFQRLASGYADTPEGATAKSELAARVQVSGMLTGYPRNPTPVVYLSRTIRGNTYFSDDYSARLDSTGHFTFTNVAPGKYNLSAAVPNGSGVFWTDPATPYNIVVGPLCSLTLQPYPYS